MKHSTEQRHGALLHDIDVDIDLFFRFPCTITNIANTASNYDYGYDYCDYEYCAYGYCELQLGRLTEEELPFR